MMETARQSREQFLRSQIGKTEDILFECTVTEEGTEGHTKNYVPVYVKADIPFSRKIFPVRITGVNGDHCTGELA